MIKKLILISIFSILLFSCGKKGDPEYKADKNDIPIFKSLMKYINKSLTIEKIKVQDIAKKFGTPIYCYSYKQLKENISNFKKNFKSFSPLICFAIKSNTNVNLIREIRNFGLGADVVSIGELMMALKGWHKSKKNSFFRSWKNLN